jgi:rod shape-determining protein MreC
MSNPRVSPLGVRALVFVVLSIGLMVIDQRQHRLGALRGALSTAMTPIARVLEAPFSAWENVSSLFGSRAGLQQQVEALERARRDDAVRLQHLEALEHENERLRALLNAAPRDAEKSRVGHVLRVELDALRRRVLVDRGAADGVTSNEPVIDADGVFGQTTVVGATTAEVIMLSDPNHAIPVQIERNGLRTIAVGTGNPDHLMLPYLPRNAEIEVGDHLLTSGLGGVFPPGLPVAIVSEVRRDPSQPLVQVRATPFAHLEGDREILIVTYASPTTMLPDKTATPAPAVKNKPSDNKPAVKP